MPVPVGAAKRVTEPHADLPLAVDVSFYADFIRRGLLAYRVVSIFLSAFLVVLSIALVIFLIHLLNSAASAQTVFERQADVERAEQVAGFLILLGVPMVVTISFVLFRFAAARFVMFLILATPAFFQFVLGGLKLTGLATGRGTFDVHPQMVLIQGAVMVVGGLLLLGIAGGILDTLRLDRQTFRQVWRLGRAPLQILNTPRWFFRLGFRSYFAVPVYVAINAIFCCSVAFLFYAVYAAPIHIDLALAQGLKAFEAGDPRLLGKETFDGLGYVLMSAGLAAGTAWLLRQGRRLGVAKATAFRQRDGRAPVLFLRSFHDDQVFLGKLRLSSLARLLSFETYPTNLDAMLAHEALAVGPPIALGNPSDRRAVSGVPRDWVADTDWQDRILAELDSAAKIILVVDETAGTRWEMERIAGNPAWLARTVLLKPPRIVPSLPALPDALESSPSHISLSKLWAQPFVFGIEMGDRGPEKIFMSRRPDALEYQCLLREVLRPEP